MLKNGVASVISSSDTVGGGGGGGRRGVHSRGRLNKGTFIDGYYLLGGWGRSYEGAFIQSITAIRTCFSFWIFYVFQCHLFPIQIKLFVYLNYLSFKK